MTSRLAAALLLLAACSGGGAPMTTAAPVEAQSVSAAETMALLRQLSDDSLRGRMTGQPGAAKAAALIAREMQRLGLEPAGDSGQVARTLATARRAPTADGTRDWWYLRGAGDRPLTVEVNCRDLREDRTVRGYVITMRDITHDDPRQRDLIQQALAMSPGGPVRPGLETRP